MEGGRGGKEVVEKKGGQRGGGRKGKGRRREGIREMEGRRGEERGGRWGKEGGRVLSTYMYCKYITSHGNFIPKVLCLFC